MSLQLFLCKTLLGVVDKKLYLLSEYSIFKPTGKCDTKCKVFPKLRR